MWLVIAVLFAAVFFSAGTERFTDQDHVGSRTFVASIILPGLLFNLVALFRSRRGRSEGDLDERDDAIARRASEVTLTALAALVFVASIALYEFYRELGTVPVGWLYFMAYGAVIVVSLLHPAVTLVVDYRGRVDG
jgi:hypothetical protein